MRNLLCRPDPPGLEHSELVGASPPCPGTENMSPPDGIAACGSTRDELPLDHDVLE